MATRFIAIIPDTSLAGSRLSVEIERSTDLDCLYATDKLLVFGSSDTELLRLPDDRGVILGRLFTRGDPPERVRAIDPRAGQRIASTRGGSLIDHFWGGYLAMIEGESPLSIDVLRDPTGEIPCYFTDIAGATIVCSDVDTLIETGLFQPKIDWSFVAPHISHFDLRTPRTALTGLSEVLAGFRLSVSAKEKTTTAVWSPWNYVEHDDSISDERAAEMLHETVSGCVKAVASGYQRILLAVSGGFDSSVIARVLADQAVPWSAVTLMTDEAEGDERRYSRVLRDHLRMEMVEANLRPEDVDLALSMSAHLPRPVGFNVGQSEQKTRAQLVERFGADAYFTGIGGDNVFSYLNSAAPIWDRCKAEGLGTHLWSSARDVCHLTQQTIWQAVRSAINLGVIAHAPSKWRSNLRFMNRSAVTSGDVGFAHPWLGGRAGALPGKLEHITMLARIQGTVDGYSRRERAQLIMPLRSQPIVEMCLRLQSWKWVAGGINRSLARRAFASTLPSVIIERQSKGGPDSFVVTVLESQRRELREHLVGGVLRQQNLIDGNALARALAEDEPIHFDDYVQLSALAEAEAWARHWHTREQRQSKREVRPGIVAA